MNCSRGAGAASDVLFSFVGVSGSPKDVALPAQAAEGDQLLLGFSQVVQSQDTIWEYSILVTFLEGEWENHALAQLYRNRGDAENTFDELKNHWVGAGSQPRISSTGRSPSE